MLFIDLFYCCCWCCISKCSCLCVASLSSNPEQAPQQPLQQQRSPSTLWWAPRLPPQWLQLRPTSTGHRQDLNRHHRRLASSSGSTSRDPSWYLTFARALLKAITFGKWRRSSVWKTPAACFSTPQYVRATQRGTSAWVSEDEEHMGRSSFCVGQRAPARVKSAAFPIQKNFSVLVFYLWGRAHSLAKAKKKKRKYQHRRQQQSTIQQQNRQQRIPSRTASNTNNLLNYSSDEQTVI